MNHTIRIGTRGSKLALTQSRWVQSELRKIHPDAVVDLVVIKTTGDRFLDQPLSTLGGKGVFVKEIEEALLAHQIDCAVHSMKDVPNELAPGLVLAAVPHREDARDVLIARGGTRLQDLPPGARVGTSSLRRMALLLLQRPDLRIEPLRGNVDSRLRKLDAGELDAIVLAAAGLRRLGIERDEAEALDLDMFLPAVGQGALAIESRDDDTVALLAELEHTPTRIAVTAERAFLRAVGGSCHTPLAAHATLAGDDLRLDALVASPDGRAVVRRQRTGAAAAAAAIGTQLGEQILDLGGREILRALIEEPEHAR